MYHGSGVDGMQSMLPATVYTNSKPRPPAVPAGGPYVVNGSSTGWINWQVRGSRERRAGAGMRSGRRSGCERLGCRPHHTRACAVLLSRIAPSVHGHLPPS
eukprot:5955209-Prymnesium_polylepis.1